MANCCALLFICILHLISISLAHNWIHRDGSDVLLIEKLQEKRGNKSWIDARETGERPCSLNSKGIFESSLHFHHCSLHYYYIRTVDCRRNFLVLDNLEASSGQCYPFFQSTGRRFPAAKGACFVAWKAKIGMASKQAVAQLALRAISVRESGMNLFLLLDSWQLQCTSWSFFGLRCSASCCISWCYRLTFLEVFTHTWWT